MSSSLSLVLVDLFMGHYKSDFSYENSALKVLYYRMYVNTLFAVFETINESFQWNLRMKIFSCYWMLLSKMTNL